jgi:hypothetical protein
VAFAITLGKMAEDRHTRTLCGQPHMGYNRHYDREPWRGERRCFSDTEIATGVFARAVARGRGLIQTVPPDLARCEFECRAPTCTAERFDACEKRLEYVVRHLAAMRPAQTP